MRHLRYTPLRLLALLSAMMLLLSLTVAAPPSSPFKALSRDDVVPPLDTVALSEPIAQSWKQQLIQKLGQLGAGPSLANTNRAAIIDGSTDEKTVKEVRNQLFNRFYKNRLLYLGPAPANDDHVYGFLLKSSNPFSNHLRFALLTVPQRPRYNVDRQIKPFAFHGLTDVKVKSRSSLTKELDVRSALPPERTSAVTHDLSRLLHNYFPHF